MNESDYIGHTLGEFREATKHLSDNTPICGIDHFGGQEILSRIVIKDDGKWIGVDYYKGEGPD